MNNSAVFTFDTRPFMQSLQKMESALNKSSKALSNIGHTITSSINNAVHKAVGTVAKLTAGFLSINAALKAMPVVGKSLDIMKDIFTRNFFWPLQKEIMPLLQKLMNWVTSNRALFVQWGQHVANVFKMVINVGKQVWETLKMIGGVLNNLMRDIFGFDSLSDWFRTFIVQVQFILLFFNDLIRKVVGGLPNALTTIVNAGETVIKDVVGWITRLWNAIPSGTGTAVWHAMTAFFEALYKVASKNLNGIVTFLEKLMAPNENGDSIKTFFEALTPVFEGLGKLGEAASKGLWDGINESIGPVMTTLTNMVNTIGRIIGKLLGTNGEGTGVKQAFKMVGDVIGTVVSTAIAALSSLLIMVEFLIDGIQTMIESFKNPGTLMENMRGLRQRTLSIDDEGNPTGYLANMTEQFRNVPALKSFADRLLAGMVESEMSSGVNAAASMSEAEKQIVIQKAAEAHQFLHGEGTAGGLVPNALSLIDRLPWGNKDRLKQWQTAVDDQRKFQEVFGRSFNPSIDNVHDGIVTPDGKVVKTDPKDFIIATKNPESLIQSGSGGPIYVTFGDVNVTSTEGDAQNTGMTFANTFAQEFASKVVSQMYAEGYV